MMHKQKLFRTIIKHVMVIQIILIALAAPGQNETYRPFKLGNWWEYDGVHNEHEIQRVDRIDSLWGYPVYAVQYDESTGNDDLENYWTTEAGGSILLWGFYRELDSFGWIYDPPIIYVDAPLYMGKVWSCTSDVYDLPDTTYSQTFELTFRVYEEGIATVPAGDFYSYGVGYDFVPYQRGNITKEAGRKRNPIAEYLNSCRFLPNGERKSDYQASMQQGSPMHWYSIDVGEVQYALGDTFQLVNFIVTGVQDHELPPSTVLYQNYPNPFNPTTRIKYYINEDCHVELAIYDVLGRKVVSLVDELQVFGEYIVNWDARSLSGNQVSSGIYFYRLQTDDFTETRKMILLR